MRSCSSKSYDPVISAHFREGFARVERALLALAAKRFQCDALRAHLVVADDDGEPRTARVRLLHLRLEAAARSQHHVPAGIAPCFREPPRRLLRRLARMHDED